MCAPLLFLLPLGDVAFTKNRTPRIERSVTCKQPRLTNEGTNSEIIRRVQTGNKLIEIANPFKLATGIDVFHSNVVEKVCRFFLFPPPQRTAIEEQGKLKVAKVKRKVKTSRNLRSFRSINRQLGFTAKTEKRSTRQSKRRTRRENTVRTPPPSSQQPLLDHVHGTSTYSWSHSLSFLLQICMA